MMDSHTYQGIEAEPGIDGAERRESERVSLRFDISVSLLGGDYKAELLDISGGGAKFRLAEMPGVQIRPSAAVTLGIPHFGTFDGRIVWADGAVCGMRFHENHKAIVGLIRSSIAAT